MHIWYLSNKLGNVFYLVPSTTKQKSKQVATHHCLTSIFTWDFEFCFLECLILSKYKINFCRSSKESLHLTRKRHLKSRAINIVLQCTNLHLFLWNPAMHIHTKENNEDLFWSYSPLVLRCTFVHNLVISCCICEIRHCCLNKKTGLTSHKKTWYCKAPRSLKFVILGMNKAHSDCISLNCYLVFY